MEQTISHGCGCTHRAEKPTEILSDEHRVIERVLGDRAHWDGMRLRARQHVESERTWARSVARYQDVYHELLSGPKATPIDAAAQRG